MVELLFELIKRVFDKASEVPEGRDILRIGDGEVICFNVTDGEKIYVAIEDGEARVSKREFPVKEGRRVETIEAPEEVFRMVFMGKQRLVDAAWEGRMRARIYHGRTDLYYMLSKIIKIANNIADYY